MATKALTPPEFRAECERRLLDAFEVMLHLGLRSRQGVWNRVATEKIPAPVINRPNGVAFWDKETLPEPKEA